MNLKSAPATVLVGSAGLVLLVLAGWLGLIGPALTSIGEVDTARADAQARYGTLRLQLVELRRQAEELPATGEHAAELDRIFPPTADQPGFFAQVTAAADRAGIPAGDVTTVSPDVPVLVSTDPDAPAGDPAALAEAPDPADVLAEARGAADDASARDDEATADPESDPTTDPTTDPATGEAGQDGDAEDGTTPTPVSTSGYAVQLVEIAVEGDYQQLVAMLRHLESMDRALLSMQAGVSRDDEGLYTLTLTGSTFVAPPLGSVPAVPGA